MRFRRPEKGVSLAAAVALVAGCAHVEAPRGGPPDETPPSVIATVPAPDTVLPSFAGPVVFRFDERISERGLEETVIVSPRTSPVQISHGRDALRVSLRGGWLPDQIYHVTLRSEVSDLFGNRLQSPVSLVFSTGPDIPDTESSGTVIDRVTGERAVGVRVEAIRTADSLVYAVPTDTAGRFALDRIPEGDYLFRAFEDVNANRSLEIFEPRDSAQGTVAAGEPVAVALRLLMPDSTPPVAASASAREELVQVMFDDYLDPEQEFDPAQATVVGPDGAVQVTTIALATAAASTTADTSAGAGQTPPTDPPPAAQPGPVDQPAPAGAAVTAPDTAGILPSRSLTLTFGAASDLAAPGEYRISLTGIRNVNGLVGDSEVTLTVAPTEPNAARRVSGPIIARYIGGPPTGGEDRARNPAVTGAASQRREPAGRRIEPERLAVVEP